jgi:hypothetical protein
MADFIEILDELEKVNLAPILVPALKMADPLLGSLPRGFLPSMLSRQGTRNSLIKTVAGLSPMMPDMIRFLGHISESKLATGLLSLSASISTPIMRLSAPIASKLVVPLSGPMLGLVGRSVPLLPLLIKGMDRLVRVELLFERGLKRLVPS